MNPGQSVRTSPIAGSWYSADPKTLADEIDQYIDDAAVPESGQKIIGLIAPHAGYFYSGKTAGYAYRCVRGAAFDLCVVVSPLHAFAPYPLITSAHEAYSTPLGQVNIDKEMLSLCTQKIQQQSGVTLQPIANDQEHSLEIQIPFLQRALASTFKLIPIMVRTNESILLKQSAQAIADALKNKSVLLVASTDLSHFYSEKVANDLDKTMLRQIEAFSPDGVLEAENNGEGYACGAGAVALVLWVARYLGADRVTILHHSTSADAAGDRKRVVGYGAGVISKTSGLEA